MKSLKQYKIVEWSYPTSPNAKRFGFYHIGCFTLQIGTKSISGHLTMAGAKQAGECLPQEWHPAMSEGWRSK